MTFRHRFVKIPSRAVGILAGMEGGEHELRTLGRFGETGWRAILWKALRVGAIALVVLSFLWTIARGECPVP